MAGRRHHHLCLATLDVASVIGDAAAFEAIRLHRAAGRAKHSGPPFPHRGACHTIQPTDETAQQYPLLVNDHWAAYFASRGGGVRSHSAYIVGSSGGAIPRSDAVASCYSSGGDQMLVAVGTPDDVAHFVSQLGFEASLPTDGYRRKVPPTCEAAVQTACILDVAPCQHECAKQPPEINSDEPSSSDDEPFHASSASASARESAESVKEESVD